jgi:tight adherence protein B
MNSENFINNALSISAFVLVFSVWCICVVIWLGRYLLHAKSMRERLGIVEKKTSESQTLHLWREAYKDIRAAGPKEKQKLRERLERLRNDAGWQAPVKVIILGLTGTAGLAFVITYALAGRVVFGLCASAGVVAVFWAYTKTRVSKRAELFEKQLVDALGIAARALRAGHPLVGAFRLISEKIPEPLGPVFYQVCQEQALGLDQKDSLRKAANQTQNSELKLFATAVAIQLTSGGNLAELMDSLALVMRARIRLNRRVRVITAQTQFSKNVLIALPFLLFFLLNFVNAEYMRPFYDTRSGRYLLVTAAAIVLFGTWIMNRMAVLRY